MAFDKTDKNFKASINKKFTTPERSIYQEQNGKTINIHQSELWVDTISSTPATAILNGVAEAYTQQVLTPDPIYLDSVFFFMVDSGSFTAGVDNYDIGIANNAQRSDFISNKYGDNYSALLYDNSNNLISETDSIEWFFDYVTGILHITNPGSYALPYKISVYRYIGNILPSLNNIIKKFNLTDKNLLASVTLNDGDLACATAISVAPSANSGVRIYLNNTRVESGNTINDYCYFSGDGGSTKRAFGAEQQNDLLYWNGSVALYELEADDYITFDYIEA